MESNSIKVGSELLEIEKKIEHSKELIDNALKIYTSIFPNINNEYLGNCNNELAQYTNSYILNMKRLSEFYELSSNYVMYAFKQLNFTDEQLASLIQSEISS